MKVREINNVPPTYDAVQWHKGVAYPGLVDNGSYVLVFDKTSRKLVHDGDWLVQVGDEVRVYSNLEFRTTFEVA